MADTEWTQRAGMDSVSDSVTVATYVDQAEAARDAAQGFEAGAEAAEANAAASAAAAAQDATDAATSETNAATSEANAAASETAAAASETAAATSETNAATSETNAATSETNATASAAAALASQGAAATSEANAAASEAGAEAAATRAEAAAASVSLEVADYAALDALTDGVEVGESVRVQGLDQLYTRVNSGGHITTSAGLSFDVVAKNGVIDARALGSLDGSDASTVINAALGAASTVVIPSGSYTIEGRLNLQSGTTLLAHGVTLTATSSFTSSDPENYKNRSTVLINDVDDVEIHGLKIVCATNQNTVGNTSFVLRNASRVRLVNCGTDTDPSHLTGRHSAWDIYGGCEDIEISGGTYVQNSTDDEGGNWIRAINADTTNVDIHDATFIRTGGVDEIIAAFGVINSVSNVRIHHNRIVRYAGGKTQDVCITAFSTADVSETGATCENVSVDHNHIEFYGGASVGAFHCGRDNTASLTTNRNITFDSNQIYVGGMSGGFLFYAPDEAENVVITNNSMHWTDTGEVTNLFSGNMSTLTGNTGDVYATRIFNKCPIVGQNRISNLATGGEMGRAVGMMSGGSYAADGGFTSLDDDGIVMMLRGVDLTLTGSTISLYQQTLTGADEPLLDMEGCRVHTENALSFMFNIQAYASGDSKSRLVNNTFTGTVPTAYAAGTASPLFGEVRGNDWYGQKDDARSSAHINNGHTKLYPLGAFVRDSAATVDVNGDIRLGWVKTTNTPTSTDWKEVYVGNTAVLP